MAVSSPTAVRGPSLFRGPQPLSLTAARAAYAALAATWLAQFNCPYVQVSFFDVRMSSVNMFDWFEMALLFFFGV